MCLKRVNILSNILVAAAALSTFVTAISQGRPAEPQATTGPQASVREEPPFDKLELFAFLSAAPYDPYASKVIQARGTSFAPDAAFISAIPVPAFREIVRKIKPRTSTPISAARDAAYELLRKGWRARENREFTSANQSIAQALQLAPDSATLHLAYATGLLFSQNYSEASAQARQSLRLWPDNAEAHAALALSLNAQRQFAEGESESREALNIFPENHSAMFSLGMSLTYEQKFKEAIPVLQNLVVALPKMLEARKFLGISLLESGEVADGLSQLSLYVRSASQDAEGHYYLGAALRTAGRPEEARSQFAEALRLKPDNPEYQAAAHSSW
jgi:Flp pilus assembly protein TadD